uniref:hypothetical protein n=1 Tax=Stappia sp. TaxID=1870903 RepID=UPI003BAD940D
MPLKGGFNKTGSAPRSKEKDKKRPSPFCIRLSEADRARLAMEAAGTPLGAYIKQKALGLPAQHKRMTGLTIKDRQAFAQALALLGQSRLASNLNQLAHAVNTGSLPITPETESFLLEAVQDVRELRRLFLLAVGMKPEDAP